MTKQELLDLHFANHARVMPRKVAPVEVKTSSPQQLEYANDDGELCLYHKTATRNVPSIMENGLVPRYGKPTQGQNPAYNAVYFHTNPKRTAEFKLDEPATVLKITIPINAENAGRLYPDEDTFCKNAAECITNGEPVAYRGTIAPEHIETLQKSLDTERILPTACSPSALVGRVDKKAHNHLTDEEIRDELRKGGPRYVLTAVNPNKLNIQDEHTLMGVQRDFNQANTKPIIVGMNGFIIDGRHRTASAKLSGAQTINAYVPEKDLDRYQLRKSMGGNTLQPRLIIDLEKAWYQSALDSGAHWVTIKEGPLHGRHILIDSQGFIVAGKGIPQHVLKKINGAHIGDTKHAPLARKDAYQQEYNNLGKQSFEDSKGQWTVDHVTRDHRDENGRNSFQTWIDFKPGTDAAKKKLPFGKTGRVYFYDNDDKNKFKERLQYNIGYTPTPSVMDQIWDYAQKLKDAHLEEDRHYAEHSDEDRKDAKGTLDELHNRALDNYKQGDDNMVGLNDWQKKSPHGYRAYQKYLSPEDQNKAREAQNVLNGHAWQAPEDINRRGHLDEFNKRLENSMQEHRLKMEQKAREEKKERLDNLMETDPNFRRLVAHWAAAKQEGKAKDNRVNLQHRLFGYTNNFEDWRDDLNNKYWPLLEKFGMGHHDEDHLERLAKEHADNLPAVKPTNERKIGAFHYGDHVVTPNGDHKTLEKVGNQYGYFRGDDKNKLSELKHVKEDPEVPAPPKEEPKPETKTEKPAAAKKGKGDGKGYGDDATMYVTGPRSFNHMKNLKHTHGGAWNAEEKRWEYNHAPGSEGHKALEEYVNKYHGIDLTHIEKPGAPKEEPKEEPKQEQTPEPPKEEPKTPEPPKEEPKEEPKQPPKEEPKERFKKVQSGDNNPFTGEKIPPKPVERTSDEDIRTEEQAGRNTSYDVGDKIGGARKDTYMRHFTDAPTPGNLAKLEHEAPELAQLYAKKKHIMMPEKEQYEKDMNNGVEFRASMLKGLLYKRIAAEPARNTPEGRMEYVSAIHELKRILEPLRSYEDMKNAINELARNANSTRNIKFFKDQRQLATEKLNSPKSSDYDKSSAKRTLDHYTPDRIKEMEDNYLKFPFEALGEQMENFMGSYKSRERTYDTLHKKTSGMTWETFGGETKEPKETTTKAPRGEEKKKWERDTVAEHLRKGGRATEVEKPEHLLHTFGIRGVEFGHWVDDASGKYHLKRSAEALHDMADVLGLHDKDMSLNGRLALAFGARGKGGAAAHYEPAKKVINMTKYGGAGSLAHEWGHAMDNILAQYSAGGQASLNMASAAQMGNHDPELKRLYEDLMKSIKEPTPGTGLSGKRTVDLDTEKTTFGTYYPEMRRMVEGDKSFEDTYKHFSDQFQSKHLAKLRSIKNSSYMDEARKDKELTKEIRRHNREMRDLPHRIAEEQRYASDAFKRYKKSGNTDDFQASHFKKTVTLPTNESDYYARCKGMDGSKAYYSLPEEMFARVFESYMQHKLEKAGRYNNYLVHGTDDRGSHPLHPFPTGGEREAMFSKMEALLNHVTNKKALEKALRMELLGRAPKLFIKVLA